jgi:hypothetical protein
LFRQLSTALEASKPSLRHLASRLVALRIHRGRDYACCKWASLPFWPWREISLSDSWSSDKAKPHTSTLRILVAMIPSTHSTIPRHSVWSRESAKFLVPIAATVVAVQILFLVDISYLNGALYHEAERVHNLKVLLVDYDQGPIEDSLRSAADSL